MVLGVATWLTVEKALTYWSIAYGASHLQVDATLIDEDQLLDVIFFALDKELGGQVLDTFGGLFVSAPLFFLKRCQRA